MQTSNNTNHGTKTLILMLCVTAVTMGSSTCPVPTRSGPCGVQSSPALPNDCESVNSTYYTDNQMSCLGSSGANECVPNLQQVTVTHAWYTLATGTNSIGQQINWCTGNYDPLHQGPNPSNTLWGTCQNAYSSSATCGSGSGSN